MKKGIIFDIQRCSLVDGDGVRTAIFFKGCNLKCKWCHNPEGIDKNIQMLYYKDKCTFCGKCTQICPNEQKSCTLCGKCTVYCPADAKEICGKEYAIKELLDIILKDKTYYEASGGGVTLSGGECMLQIDFVKELLKKCRENQINTAVDTAGNVEWKCFEEILPYTNTFLFDIKCISENLHKQGTGVSNLLILKNLKRLSDANANIVIRIPIIGGFNDSYDELLKISQFLKNINFKKVELLPYHNMGKHKYEALNLESHLFSEPQKEQIDKFKKLFA
ncbi:MAG: glycyl-radical enzyme activating protein [Clostridia bacterium]|nr:glycyl-radical enzyme activating protein [Clostridia bacterium]